MDDNTPDLFAEPAAPEGDFLTLGRYAGASISTTR